MIDKNKRMNRFRRVLSQYYCIFHESYGGKYLFFYFNLNKIKKDRIKVKLRSDKHPGNFLKRSDVIKLFLDDVDIKKFLSLKIKVPTKKKTERVCTGKTIFKMMLHDTDIALMKLLKDDINI